MHLNKDLEFLWENINIMYRTNLSACVHAYRIYNRDWEFRFLKFLVFEICLGDNFQLLM